MIFLLVLCCLLFYGSSGLENELNNDGENNTWKSMDLSPRHRIKDSSYLLDRYPIGELSPDVSTCRRSAKCVPLHKGTCMGTKLPYSFTTLDLIPERMTQDIIEVDRIIIYILFVLVIFPILSYKVHDIFFKKHTCQLKA